MHKSNIILSIGNTSLIVSSKKVKKVNLTPAIILVNMPKIKKLPRTAAFSPGLGQVLSVEGFFSVLCCNHGIFDGCGKYHESYPDVEEIK